MSEFYWSERDWSRRSLSQRLLELNWISQVKFCLLLFLLLNLYWCGFFLFRRWVLLALLLSFGSFRFLCSCKQILSTLLSRGLNCRFSICKSLLECLYLFARLLVEIGQHFFNLRVLFACYCLVPSLVDPLEFILLSWRPRRLPSFTSIRCCSRFALNFFSKESTSKIDQLVLWLLLSVVSSSIFTLFSVHSCFSFFFKSFREFDLLDVLVV